MRMFKWFDLILPLGHPSSAEGPDSSQQTSKCSGEAGGEKLESAGSPVQDEVELAEAHKAVSRLGNGKLQPSTCSL